MGSEGFDLILCPNDVHDRTVDAEKKNGRLYYLLHEPLIISEVRSVCTFRGDDPVSKRGWCIPPSAL